MFAKAGPRIGDFQEDIPLASASVVTIDCAVPFQSTLNSRFERYHRAELRRVSPN
jgi:hypothetical protein